MILPGKHIKLSRSILNVSSVLIQNIDNRQSIATLYNKTISNPNIRTYEIFIMGLDLLFIFGLITLDDDRILRLKK